MAIGTVTRTFHLDDLDLLSKKASQLDALLQMTYGAGGEVFRDGGADSQDNYLWACSELSADVKELVRKIGHG